MGLRARLLGVVHGPQIVALEARPRDGLAARTVPGVEERLELRFIKLEGGERSLRGGVRRRGGPHVGDVRLDGAERRDAAAVHERAAVRARVEVDDEEHGCGGVQGLLPGLDARF